MRTKIILKNIGIVFLACYFFLAIIMGWDYMLHAINPNFVIGNQQTFGPIEFASWLTIITSIIFIPFAVAMFFIFLGAISRDKKSPHNLAQQKIEKKLSSDQVGTKKTVLLINIFLPCILFLVLFVTNIFKNFFDLPATIEGFFATAMFIIPFYVISGLINSTILYFFSRIDMRILNMKFVLLFVLFFSVLILVFKPFWFEQSTFFLILLIFTITAINTNKIILKIRNKKL